jgi:hypothetical protein
MIGQNRCRAWVAPSLAVLAALVGGRRQRAIALAAERKTPRRAIRTLARSYTISSGA